MITNGTRVQNREGLIGTVIGEPEQTPTGLVATVQFDDAFAAGTPTGRVDEKVTDLTELVEDASFEHRTDCECECAAMDENTDDAQWEHESDCDCSCGSPID